MLIGKIMTKTDSEYRKAYYCESCESWLDMALDVWACYTCSSDCCPNCSDTVHHLHKTEIKSKFNHPIDCNCEECDPYPVYGYGVIRC